MGLLRKVGAYTAGWGEIINPLPPWMKSNGLVHSGSDTTLSADIAPDTRIDLIESRGDANWKLAVQSWAEGGQLQREQPQVIGRRKTPPILLRAAFVRACLRGLEDFDKHYEGSADVAQVLQRIHEIRTSGLL